MNSAYLENKIELGKKLVNELLKKYSYVSLLGKHVFGKSIRVTNVAKSISDSIEKQCGFVVKVYHDGLYSEYSFKDFEESNYNNIIKNVESNLNLDKDLLRKKMKLGVLSDEPLKKDFARPFEGKEYSTDEIIKDLEEITSSIQTKDERIIQCGCLYEKYEVNAFFISKNRELTQSYGWSYLMPLCVMREGNNVKFGRIPYYGINVEKEISTAKSEIDKVVENARTLLKAERIDPGEYDIITHPSITGLIAHEAFGHGVEMDMFVKHRAKSRLYINKPVASSLVSMHDGAAAAFSCASYFFDDDGVLAHDTKIIDKGILVSGISDVIAANELGTDCTGNSRRESPFRKAYTRMTNTFFEPGDSTVDEMVKSVKHGYMLFETNNGMEDPKNWNIQCVAEYGLEIKDGEFTGKVVSPVVMSGYVPDLLMSISMVSKEFEVIGLGHCGKGHKEWVPVSDGGPYLKARCKLS